MSLPISHNVEQLIEFAKQNLQLLDEDEIYVRNKLLFLLNVTPYEGEVSPVDSSERSPERIVKPMVDHAVKKKIITEADRLRFETQLIDAVCPPPSVVMQTFDEKTREGMQSACNYLYDFSFKTNYIRLSDVEQNIRWTADCEKGKLEITVNIAKPEKNNKDIAKNAKVKSTGYPACPLCKENVGCYNPPFRQTLRTIPIFLGDEEWHFQYSPYNYYKEHCIVFSNAHTPMQPTNDTIYRLLDFVELFPNYFMGSNAALPIIGGSILTHDHFQGGAKVMPFFNAKTKIRLSSPEFPSVRITVPDWYNSVIRVESTNKMSVAQAAIFIKESFERYKNEKLGIIPATTEQHSAVSPIVRLNDSGEYCIDIFLRNNRTDEKYPDGIFHVSPDLFNIKQEGIGLIEAMGVFILPGRLAREAEMIKDYLTGSESLNLKKLAEDTEHPLNKHLGFIAQLVNDHGIKLSDDDAAHVIESAINKACERILRCTAVFKDTEAGTKAFLKFLASMDMQPSNNC